MSSVLGDLMRKGAAISPRKQTGRLFARPKVGARHASCALGDIYIGVKGSYPDQVATLSDSLRPMIYELSEVTGIDFNQYVEVVINIPSRKYSHQWKGQLFEVIFMISDDSYARLPKEKIGEILDSIDVPGNHPEVGR